MRADILSWSRARGVFGGLSLQGGTLRADEDANKALYSSNVTTQNILTGKTKNPIHLMHSPKRWESTAVCNKQTMGTANRHLRPVGPQLLRFEISL